MLLFGDDATASMGLITARTFGRPKRQALQICSTKFPDSNVGGGQGRLRAAIRWQVQKGKRRTSVKGSKVEVAATRFRVCLASCGHTHGSKGPSRRQSAPFWARAFCLDASQSAIRSPRLSARPRWPSCFAGSKQPNANRSHRCCQANRVSSSATGIGDDEIHQRQLLQKSLLDTSCIATCNFRYWRGAAELHVRWHGICRSINGLDVVGAKSTRLNLCHSKRVSTSL
jgi:hypothetical protein